MKPCLKSLVLLAIVLTPTVCLASSGDWPNWGGPNGDFSIDQDPGLATQWGEDGPTVLWHKALGDHGHSAIVTQGSTLYTTYRESDKDVVVAVDIESGETLWQRSYDSPLPENHNYQFGPGPHSTPTIKNGRLFLSSAGVLLTALDLSSGEEVWQRDLMAEEEVSFMHRGYGASPLAVGDLLILNGGGNGQGIMAVRQSDGGTVWKVLDGEGSYSSPVLMELDGVEQVVVSLGARKAGLEPETGKVLWQLDLPDSAATTMATQVQVGPQRIFTSSAYGDGSRLYEVRRNGDQWQAEESWYTRKMRIMHGSVAAFGNLVYGSSGDFGPTFLTAVDLDTGEIAFRQRGFAKANLSRVGDKILLLDEDGTLALGKPSPDGVEILAQSSVLNGVSWTPPTLVGTTLLVRNREEMVAFDLAASGASSGTAVNTKTDDGDSAGQRFERTAGGLTIEIPDELSNSGSVYYVNSAGDDAQVVLRSETPLQRTAVLSRRAVGAFVVPFDLDQEEARKKPLLAGSLRIPIASLEGITPPMHQLLFGGFKSDSGYSEIVIDFLEVKNVMTLPSSDLDVLELTFDARALVRANATESELEMPVELTFQAAKMETMSRNVGDLASFRTQFEIDAGKLGISVPPQMGLVMSESLAVDLFLGLSTVTPDQSFDPSVDQSQYDKRNRYLVLARDLGDDRGAYRLLDELIDDSWDDARGLGRVAFTIVTEPGLERRPMGLARKAAQRASELRSEDPMALNTLARVQYEIGEVAEAVASQRRALELVGDSPSDSRTALEANLERYESALALQ